jgi:hypothetical protein
VVVSALKSPAASLAWLLPPVRCLKRFASFRMNPTGAPSAPLRRLPALRLLAILAVASGTRVAAQGGTTPSSPVPSDNNGGMGAFSPIRIRPVVICFPPTPPPLDRAVSRLPPLYPARFAPPAELAAYVNEPFYAPLSTWLIEHKLSDKMSARLAALRAAEAAALTQLHATLDPLRTAEAPARRAALEAFARQQTPSLAALERDAEQIRRELATGSYDWRSLREWALGGTSRRGDSPAEIAATMRAYAFYQTGLVPGQRRLLREISLELAMAAADTAAATAAQPHLFFPPEPARVLLPDDLPAALAARVAAYQTKKSALKKELYDAVYKQDDAAFGFLRNNALKALADQQAPRLAELETLAEEIRRGLAELPSPTRATAERSPLPPVLTERLDATARSGTELQRDTIRRIDTLRAGLKDQPIQLSYSFDSAGLHYVVIPRPPRAGSNARSELEKLRPLVRELEARLDEIAADYGRRYADLVNETNAIRREAAAALGQASARTVDAALTAARRASVLKESADAYRDYRLAVFEPGLSPEQRRLLFGGALAKLDLPLPAGEPQPVRRAAGW